MCTRIQTANAMNGSAVTAQTGLIGEWLSQTRAQLEMRRGVIVIEGLLAAGPTQCLGNRCGYVGPCERAARPTDEYTAGRELAMA